MRISDWSSDVCSSDLSVAGRYADAGVTIERRDQWPAAELLGEADAVVVDQPEVRAATLDALARGSAVLLTIDRKSVVYGKRVSVRVDLGGRRHIKKKKKSKQHQVTQRVTNIKR